MKKLFLILGIIVYIFAAISYCYHESNKITPEPPAINTYAPIEAELAKQPVLIANTCLSETPIEPIELRYGFTDEEVLLLAQLLCGSAKVSGDGEYDFVWKGKVTNYCEMGKVLCVVMNRVRNDKFPNTVKEVVLQQGQFTGIRKRLNTVPDDLAIQTIRGWCDAYDIGDPGVQIIPENHLYFGAGPNLTNITREKY